MGSIHLNDGVCAIFVHAGAGYHSRENESKHMEVCSLASEAGMAFLRCGGSAIDAVEVAIMVLEDAPITNAGYGSNLTDHGQVEGDASIMDHFGRSGAVGAVPNIKNPIQLARKVYEKSYNSMPMSRVPPNFLVGEGATDFAWENRMMVLPNDCLVANQSHQRYKAWHQEALEHEHDNPPTEEIWRRGPATSIATRLMHEYPGFQKLLDTAASEAKNGSPRRTDSIEVIPSDVSFMKAYVNSAKAARRTIKDGDGNKDDLITDTVGAIAVDIFGNIAAGASSGGIGMKHKGRVGPAALIGIGNHIIPVNPNDAEKTAVAVLTSGTGEHIASTSAARTCAEKIYHNHSLNESGSFVTVTEDEALRDMITKDFVCHPAVVNSEISASIGIMAVKKTVDGISLVFGHNTESFAIAYMSNTSSAPSCVMSRNEGSGSCAQGGAFIRPKTKA